MMFSRVTSRLSSNAFSSRTLLFSRTPFVVPCFNRKYLIPKKTDDPVIPTSVVSTPVTRTSVSQFAAKPWPLLASLAAMPMVHTANAVEASVPWYHMFGHAPSPFAEFLGVAPLGFFFFLQMSPMKSMQDIKKSKSVGNMSVLPYITLGTNCVIWATYGALQADPTIGVANAMGAILSAYYTSVFAKYSTEDMSKYYYGGGGFLAATFGGCYLAPSFGLDAINFLGIMGNVIAVGFFSSPLVVMKTVIKEKSTESMPFVVTLATSLNCMAWGAYGFLVAHDPYVIIPNAIGLGLSFVQLSLFVRFGISSPKVKPTK